MPSVAHRPWLRLATVPLLALTLSAAAPASNAFADRYDDHERYEQRQRTGYNDEYIFAATRAVTAMEVSPALKVPLVPPALILDLVALPFEVIAGLF